MLKSKRVVHVLRRFLPEQWGCNEQIVLNIARALREHGVHSTIFTTGEKIAEPFAEDLDLRHFNYFYPSLYLSASQKAKLDLKGGNPYSFGMAKALFGEECQLIHCHGHARLAATARLVAHKRNIPYIVSFSSFQKMLPKSLEEDLVKSVQTATSFGRIFDLITKPNRVVADASGILCSNFSDYQFVKKSYPLTPSLYLPGAAALARDVSDSKSTIVSDFLSTRKIQLLCVGRIDATKNQLALVELMNKLIKVKPQQHHLHLVGHVACQEYFNLIQKKIIEYGLKGQVTIHTHIKPNSVELMEFYKCCDVFISTALHEPFGLSIVEAWVAELPVLAPNIASVKNMVQHRCTGLLFNPHDVTMLWQTLAELEATPTLRQSLICQGKDRAARCHSWQIYSEKLMQFYQEVEAWFVCQNGISQRSLLKDVRRNVL